MTNHGTHRTGQQMMASFSSCTGEKPAEQCLSHRHALSVSPRLLPSAFTYQKQTSAFPPNFTLTNRCLGQSVIRSPEKAYLPSRNFYNLIATGRGYEDISAASAQRGFGKQWHDSFTTSTYLPPVPRTTTPPPQTRKHSLTNPPIT